MGNANQNPKAQFDAKTILLWLLIGFIALSGYFAWQWLKVKKELEGKSWPTQNIKETAELMPISKSDFFKFNIVWQKDNPFNREETIYIASQDKRDSLDQCDSCHIIKKDNIENTFILFRKKALLSADYANFPEDLIKFKDTGHLIIGATFGEGIGCAGGGYKTIYEIDLINGKSSELARYSFGSSTSDYGANPPDTCSDCNNESSAFSLKGKSEEIINFSALCENNGLNKKLFIVSGGKTLYEKTYRASDLVLDYILKFSIIDNALTNNNEIKFSIGSSDYIFNFKSGELIPVK